MPSGCLRCVTKEIVGRPSWFKNVKNMKCNKQQLICWLHLWIFMKCQKRCSKFMQNLAISGNLGLHLFSCSCLGQGGKPKVDASKMPPRTRCLSDASEMLLRCLWDASQYDASYDKHTKNLVKGFEQVSWFLLGKSHFRICKTQQWFLPGKSMLSPFYIFHIVWHFCYFDVLTQDPSRGVREGLRSILNPLSKQKQA